MHILSTCNAQQSITASLSATLEQLNKLLSDHRDLREGFVYFLPAELREQAREHLLGVPTQKGNAKASGLRQTDFAHSDQRLPSPADS